MSLEIERKFLLKDSSWRKDVSRTINMQQAYLNSDDDYSVRVRIEEHQANINIKSRTIGRQRNEYEYQMPLDDAKEILSQLNKKISKLRHIVKHTGLSWEIDEFTGTNEGLFVAEVELTSVDQKIDIPDWCAQEVTDDARYYNVCLLQHPYTKWVTHIEVSIADQSLQAFNQLGKLVLEYSISTAKNGAGEIKDSECTPRGLHNIRAKIGAGKPEKSVFLARRPSGEIWSSDLARVFPERDWILSRILWLSGCELGKNRLGEVDTMQRYIYMHGTSELETMGVPDSHGCIRMRNADVIELFEHVFIGTTVMINE